MRSLGLWKTILFAASALVASSCNKASPAAGTGGHGGAGGSSGLGGVFLPFDAGSPGATTGGCTDAAGEASTGCEGLEGGVSFAADIAPLLQNCTGELCHLTPTYATLVGVPTHECCDHRFLVAPSDAAQSYLMNKLTGVDLCTGSRMPLGGQPLSDSDVILVKRWICEGAPND